MINSLAKTDAEIKNDVLSELKYEPSIKFTDIGVLVKMASSPSLSFDNLDDRRIHRIDKR